MKVALRIVLIYALLSCSLACKRGTEKSGSAADKSRPNLLVISIDTLRADRVGCYGYSAARTPALDALAARSVRFARAFTHTPLTLPSHATLLTGLLPFGTGLHVNGSGSGGGALPSDVPTLATLLKAEGYRTGAFVSAAVLSARYGLNRGFDVYDDALPAPDSHAADGTHVERRGDKTRELFQSWLDLPADQPFFGWVHFFDPHFPYEAPAPFSSASKNPYDGEVAFVDAQIAMILEQLNRKKLADQTIILIVGDHGEGLNEHGEREHGLFVYNSTIHVPFLLALPGRAGGGTVVESPVGLSDVLPTLLPILGISVPPGLDGRDISGGWRGGDLAPQPVYVESEYPLHSFGWSSFYAMVTSRWKYIHSPQPEVFDLSTDPHEQSNIVSEHPEIVREMSALIGSMRGRKTHRSAAVVKLDDAARKELATLGYVGSASTTTAPAPTSDLRDPKHMLPVYYELMDGMHLLHKGDFDQAVAKLEGLALGSAEETGFSESVIDETLANLGDAYLGAQRFEDAEKVFKSSLRNAPDDGRRLTGLAIALRSQGRLDQALEQLNRAATAAPGFADAQRELASIYSHLGNLPKAIEHWRRFGELAPTSAHAQTNLGTSLVAVGKPAEAVGPLLRAISLDSKNEFAYRSLWRALYQSGRRAEAIDTLRAARRVFPDSPPFMCGLARLISITPGRSSQEHKEALELAQMCAGADMKNPIHLDTLALAFAVNGDFKKAVGTAEVARQRATDAGQTEDLKRIEIHLAAFREGRAVVE